MPAAGAAVSHDWRLDDTAEHVRGDVASLVSQDVYSLLFVTSDKGSSVLHPHVGEEHAASTEHVLDVRQSHGQTPVHVVTRNRVEQVR